MEPYLLGIDIGTGSVKGTALNHTAKVLAASQIHYQSYTPQTGYLEQDPQEIWEAFAQCIKSIHNQLNSTPGVIALSSAMHSTIAVSDQGEALMPMLTWADSRSGDIAEKLRSQLIGERIYKNTGTPIYSMSPLTKIIWMREHAASVFQKTHKFISIKEYIWFKLFGVFEIDHSIASATGLFNIESLDWDRDALILAGISEQQLSSPVRTSYYRDQVSAEAASYLSIPPNTRIVIGASDGCLANLGTIAMAKGTAAITMGTSGAIRVATKQPVNNFEAMTFSYVLDEQTFICGGPVNNGGIVLQWLLRSFLQKDLTQDNYAQLFDDIRAIPAGSEGLIFLPYITGERAPVWDSKSCGTFLGARTHHTQAHFSRAVIEGVCFGINEVLTTIEQSTGPLDKIHLSGGFIASKDWVQLLADVTGKQLCLLHTEDASAVGAVYLAMKSLGMIASYDDFRPIYQEVIDPNTEKKKIYEENFLIYKQLYGSLKTSMHQLHNLN